MIEKFKDLNTARKQLLTTAGIWVAGILLGGFWVVLPDIRKMKETSNQMSVSQEKELMLAEILHLERRLQNYSPLLSKTRDADWLMETVNRMAGESGLDLLSAAPQPVSTKGSYQKISLKIEANGGYHAIGKFVEKIENNTPLISLDGILVERQRSGTDLQVIHVVISVSTFYSPKEVR